MHILHVVGARPNFMKVAPVISALNQRDGVRQILVHTGQHYDDAMSRVFFEQLGIPAPDINLEVGQGTHAVQTAEIMLRLEPVLLERRPDLVLVYGDVNSTVAAALVCSKLLFPIGHVEAGLRSFDRTMPEEVNRVLTDRVADLLFTPSADGDANLCREGVSPDKIHLIGNVMVDTLVRFLPLADGSPVLDQLSLSGRKYILVTLHRPSNVDDPAHLAKLLDALADLSAEADVIFPVHPRTKKTIAGLSTPFNAPAVHLTGPVGYLEFLGLQRDAALVVTDSGGIQEETTYLGVPCLTMRENTERPVTVEIGTNTLIGRDTERLRIEGRRVLAGEGKKGARPPLWDGKASHRLADIVVRRQGATA
jgi:UDP-N-acetylglucosamine 2-epimerase (non-hydrolysing)